MMRKLLPVLLILAGHARLNAEDREPVLRLTQQEIRLLDDFAALKPGMTEEEVRQRLPELGASYKIENKPLAEAQMPTFRLAGIRWNGHITLADGRLQEAKLYTGASKTPSPHAPGQVMPQNKMRAIQLLVANHYVVKFGEVTERYVPDVDCPAGNPFGLRHQWLRKSTVLSVEFAKNSSTSSVQIELAERLPWEKEQRELYSKWPLEAAPKHLLIEVSKP